MLVFDYSYKTDKDVEFKGVSVVIFSFVFARWSASCTDDPY